MNLRTVPLVLGFFLVTLVLSSCRSDSKEAGPDFFFKKIKDGSIVWNSVSLELGVGDPSSTSKVDVYVGDDLLESLSQPPYTTTWNTRATADGTYSLKAIKADHSGKQSSVSISLTVRNVLIKMSVPSDLLAGAEQGFVFLSDGKGNTLASLEFHNGDRVEISNEDFNGETFILSEAYSDGALDLNIVSFLDVPRGQWTPAERDSTPSSVDSLSINFTSPSTLRYFCSANGNHAVIDENKQSIRLGTSQSPTVLFIREIDQPSNHYRLYQNVDPTNVPTVSLSDVELPLTSEIVPVNPDTKLQFVVVYGFPKKDDFKEFNDVGHFLYDLEELKVEYPGVAFPAYGSESRYDDDKVSMRTFNPEKPYDFSRFGASINFSESTEQGGVLLATEGKYDIWLLEWGSSYQNSQFIWTVIGAEGVNQLVKLPELPVVVGAAVPWVITNPARFLNAAQLADYAVADSYSSFLDYVANRGYNAPYDFGLAWKEQTFFASGSTYGGRKHTMEPVPARELLSRKRN